MFTTNYDPVTDHLMEIAESRSIISYDGFNKYYRFDETGYAQLDKANSLHIYRLHGSLSWIKEDGIIKNTRDYSLRHVGHSLNLVVFPGYKGNAEQDGELPIRFAHTTLRAHLGESRVAIVIGFSFRDDYLNRIFSQALESNKSLRLVIWNPEWPTGPESGLDELKRLHGDQIFHFGASFGNGEASGDFPRMMKKIGHPFVG